MRNKFLFALVLSAIAITGLNAQATKEVPTVADEHPWNSSASDWGPGVRSLTTYDTMGRRDSGYWLHLPGLDTFRKAGYLHDASGEETGDENFIVESRKWVMSDGARYIRTYTAGKVADEILQYYDSSTASWENWTRSTFSYDAQGRKLTNLNEVWIDGAWQNDYRMLWDHAKSQLEQQTWNGTQWTPIFRYISIVWEVPDEVMREYIRQTYQSTQGWIDFTRYKRTNGVNGGFDSFTELWNGIDTWNPQTKGSVKYDSHGNMTFQDFGDILTAAGTLAGGSSMFIPMTAAGFYNPSTRIGFLMMKQNLTGEESGRIFP